MAEIKMDSTLEGLPERKGNYFSLAKQRELERKKAEEDRMAAEVARAKHEEYLRALHETSYSYGDEDDGPFHHGEGSCR